MPYVESAGVQIYYEVIRDGFPILFETGGGGDGRMWTEGGYVDGLVGFQCILMDHRGHGRSDKPAGVENHRMERYVEDAIAVLDAVGVRRAAFWGYSAGSRVGYALAATHPERVAALIASGAIGPEDLCEPDQQADLTEGAREARQMGVGPLVQQLEEYEGIHFPEWFMRQMSDTDAEMFALELLGKTDWCGPWSLFPDISCPVLMLVGELEDPDRNNPRATELLPDGRCVIFPGLGHVGAYLRSDLALAEAVSFLRAVAGS